MIFLAAGNLQVSSSKLKDIEKGEWRMASRDELLELTGCEVGAVHPFARGISVRLLDERLMAHSVVSFNTGNMARGVVVSPHALVSALGAQLRICDLAADEEADNPAAERAEELAEEWGLPLNDARFVAETAGAAEYLAEFAAALPGPLGRSKWGADTAEEAARPMYWLRLLARLAAGASAELSCVPPAWLAALFNAGGATRYAREDALRRFVTDRTDPGLPQPAAAVGDAREAAARLVGEVVSARAAAYAEWLRGAASAGWDERRAGKVVTFLMGDAMKACRGALPPPEVRAALLERMRRDAEAAAAAAARGEPQDDGGAAPGRE